MPGKLYSSVASRLHLVLHRGRAAASRQDATGSIPEHNVVLIDQGLAVIGVDG